MNRSNPRPWRAPIAIDDIPETGRRVELAPDAASRAAIAKVAGIAGLPRLEAAYDLTRHGTDGVRVVGRVSATVEQTCVVTLDPVRNEIDEEVDLLFIENVAKADRAAAIGPLAIDAEEPPEMLEAGAVDLAAVTTEYLILGIDPYPRRPDAVFQAPPAGDPGTNPFAALAVLKKQSGEK
jgi:uncharacterized metal-binding protein YceD (DUF177 family)